MSEREQKFPISDIKVLPIVRATDIHPHTSFSDGELSLGESLREAYNDNLYEKGAIEHGNPVDEDIEHLTTFLDGSSWEDMSYTSKESYIRKFESIREVTKDISGAIPLSDADIGKVREDIEILKEVDKLVQDAYDLETYLEMIDRVDENLSDLDNSSKYYSKKLLDVFDTLPGLKEGKNTREDYTKTFVISKEGTDIEKDLLLENDQLLDAGLNYSMIVPHGVELDYNPAIEYSLENSQRAIESYEKQLIKFLKQAESVNAGYNYILLSSHYVNTPFRPRYVKKDEMFENIEQEEDMEIEEVLKYYREKEITKINSIASKLSDMSIPKISEELMTQSERRDLENFIYGFEDLQHHGKPKSDGFTAEKLDLSLDIVRPGVFAVGAHPTLIERNEEFMDYFRENQGLTTKREIRKDIERVMKKDITMHDVDNFLGEDAKSSLYPEKALEEFYRPIIEAANSEDNFIFEINGKGIERQHPSVFWQMLDEYVFGSDSHRPGEQPSRSEEFSKIDLSGEERFLAEKWVSLLEE